MKQDRLRHFERMLVEKAVPMGLIADSDRERIWERHVLDSIAATIAFTPEDHDAADLGSGAGLPGIALAIELPGVRFVLAESRARRVGFLEYAVSELQLENVSVHHGRAETLPHGAFDVATARAFAPPLRSWAAAEPLLRPTGRLVYFSGRPFDADLGADPPAIRELPVLDSSRSLVIMSRR